jgi:enolase-phosphatase E1
MIAFNGKLILLDIEGTVSPLAFVHDVMFPYARANVAAFIAANLEETTVWQALDQMARDAGHPAFAEWCPSLDDATDFVVREVHRLMDADAKVTGLKLLQGLIWEQGFRAGDLRSTIFDDVPGALLAWSAFGFDVRIYSSGSVHAQTLFFAHTEAGNLTDYFSGFYDTTIGSKREAASYTSIAADADVAPADILFISDVVEELDAARSAGLHTALALRPGNKPAPATDHPTITTFAEITAA